MRHAPAYFAHPTACIDPPSDIGAGTRIWHFCHLMPGCRIGERCVLGQNVFVATGVKLGDNVHVQNNVSLYAGVEVEDDVFLGPSCVLTNVRNPRAQVPRHAYTPTLLRRGCTVGANATLVCGTEVGPYAFVAAGAVVTSDVLPYALVVGTPAKKIGYMGRHGERLVEHGGDQWLCRHSGWRYEMRDGRLRCCDHDEMAPLPPARDALPEAGVHV